MTMAIKINPFWLRLKVAALIIQGRTIEYEIPVKTMAPFIEMIVKASR